MNVRKRAVTIALLQIAGISTALLLLVEPINIVDPINKLFGKLFGASLFDISLPGIVVIFSALIFLFSSFYFLLSNMDLSDKRSKMICALSASMILISSFFMACTRVYNLKNSLDDLNGEKVQLKARVLDTSGAGFDPGRKVLLDVIEVNGRRYSGKIIAEGISGATESYSYGDIGMFKGTLQLPKGRTNPGGMDYRLYLWTKGISSTIFVDSASKTGETQKSLIISSSLSIRNRIINFIDIISEGNKASLLKRMLVADKETGDDDSWRMVEDNFREAGLSHVMAVSGSHVNMIVIPLCFLLAKVGIKRKITNPIIIGMLIIYLPVTGFPASASRAVISTIITLVGQLLYKESDLLTSLAFASSILLYTNPMYVADPGFQLSFAAVLSIYMFFGPVKLILLKTGLSNAMSSFIALPLAVQTGLNPVCMFWFGRISLVSAPVNLIAYPVVSLLMMSGFAASFLSLLFPPIGKLPGLIANMSAGMLLNLAGISSSIPFAAFNTGSPGLVIMIITIMAMIIIRSFLLSGKDGFKEKVIAYILAAMLPLCLAGVYKYFSQRGLIVAFLDVGHGDAAFIKTPGGKTVLIDTGDPKQGRGVLLPYMAYMGINKIDIAIITHFHEDHYGSLHEIKRKIHIDTICITCLNRGEEESGLILEAREELSEGDCIALDSCVFLEVLYPSGDYEALYKQKLKEDINNTSLVIMLTYKETKFLFTGDIEKEAEDLILVGCGEKYSADVLKVAHHGSDTSSSEAFIKAVNPSVAVISTGKGRKSVYSPDVGYRLKTSGADVYRTDVDGAVVIRSDGMNLKISFRTGT